MSGADQMLLAGKISGAYGIKGWVKVHALTDPVENFLKYSSWHMRRRKDFEPIEFVDGKLHGKGLVARVRGIDSRTEAEGLRGLEIWVPATDLPELDSGDYYWFQLHGMKVWSEHGDQRQLFGAVDHLLETGANDVLVIEPCEGSIDARQRLIPYLVDSVVRDVDREAGEITVDWHPED